MMKNNKGFMLAEAVIVSVIVVTTLVVLYTSINKLYTKYTDRSRYYNLDGIYAIKNIVNYLFETNKISDVLKSVESNEYTQLIFESKCINDLVDDEIENSVCESMREFYSIKSMFITKKENVYSEDNGIKYLGKSSEELSLNQTFKDYLRYLDGYYGEGQDYSYLIILEYGEDNNKLYYSNLRLS